MTNNRAIFAFFAISIFGGTLFCLAPADAETASVDSIENSIENSFPGNVPGQVPGNSNNSDSNSGSKIAPLSSPLSGSVRVIDQLNRPTRLKRAESAPSAADQGAGLGTSASSAPPHTYPNSMPNSSLSSMGQSGGVADSGLQALFPSKDSFNPPPALNGFAGTGSAGTGASESFATADQVKPKKKHVYIWNMSLAGGYYDVTNTFQGVVPGDKLYLYGGFMADGHTPVPNGPVPMNHGGHIRWTPIMGAPPAD